MNPDTVNTSIALSGIEVVGKTAAALIIIIGLIVFCAWLLRRFSQQRGHPEKTLRVISSVAVSPKERVVVVEIDQTWLVLGVGGGNVNRLHKLPAPLQQASTPGASPTQQGFASRLQNALLRQSITPDKAGPSQ